MKENKVLSDITVHMKYAKYKPEAQRRENWKELVTRNMQMHIKKFSSFFLLKPKFAWGTFYYFSYS